MDESQNSYAELEELDKKRTYCIKLWKIKDNL